MLGMKMNLQDPRYQAMVQQLGSMQPHQSAIFNTAMANSKWAANRANLALDWFKQGTANKLFQSKYALAKDKLAHERWKNQKAIKMGKQGLKDSKTSLMWDIGLGIPKLALNYAAGKREVGRREEESKMRKKQEWLLDQQIADYKKKSGGASNYSGPSSSKMFGGNMSSAGSLTGSSGSPYWNKREMFGLGPGY